MSTNSYEQYTKTYSTFSGCDILATFNGRTIGELQAITYSVSREKSPVYTMGCTEPRSFSRGKRGIAGTLVFTQFDRDALIEEFRDKTNSATTGVQKFRANMNSDNSINIISVEDWDAAMTGYAGVGDQVGTSIGNTSDLTSTYQPVYADEILPFDITISFANEYGQRAVLVIYGVELLNEGSGFSADSVTTEKAYTFVARKIGYLKSLNSDSDTGFSSTY
jgi:hypothetical protein